MFIQELKIHHFKNFSEQKFNFHQKFNAIIGNNGTGKSSVLDAIHYLALTKSFFISNDVLNINFGLDFFLLEGKFFIDNEENFFKLKVQKGEKKSLKRNEKNYSTLSEHIGKIPTVVISPYDADLISGGSELRRKFLDNVLCQLDAEYLFACMQYQKLLQNRNILLKTFQQKNYFDEIQLEIYDVPMIKYGTYIYQKRKNFIEQFLPLFIENHQQITNNPSEKAEISYESQLNENDFETLFQLNKDKDKVLCYTQAGTHKDDIQFNLYNHQIKKIGSQGQQKSFLIALKLAQFQFLNQKLNQKPILLLDDIFDKLDHSRVVQLLKIVNQESYGQVFISHTKKEELEFSFSFINPSELKIIEI